MFRKRFPKRYLWTSPEVLFSAVSLALSELHLVHQGPQRQGHFDSAASTRSGTRRALNSCDCALWFRWFRSGGQVVLVDSYHCSKEVVGCAYDRRARPSGSLPAG
jgi:hypothetical protein